MALIGWLVVTGFMGMLSLAWLGLAFFKLGEYNIGGVPNTWKERLLVLVAGAALAYGWYTFVYLNMPFTISMKQGV